jgi:hypothetical protein
MALSHSNLLKLVLIELSHARVATAWQSDTGVARSFDGNRVIKFGLKGCSDIVGITKSGKFLAIEIKIGTDKMRPDQINFLDMIIKNKGFHFIIRNEDQIKDMINDIKNRV